MTVPGQSRSTISPENPASRPVPRQAVRSTRHPGAAQGYWARNAAGKRVSKPSLPSPETHSQKIQFAGPSSERHGEADVHPLVAFESIAANRVSIPEDLHLTDPLVLKSQRLLARAKRDAQGLVAVPPT